MRYAPGNMLTKDLVKRLREVVNTELVRVRGVNRMLFKEISFTLNCIFNALVRIYLFLRSAFNAVVAEF